MSSQRTSVAELSDPLAESDFKRRRAYEGLMVHLAVIFAVLVAAFTLTAAVSSTLADVGRVLTPGAAITATDER